MDHDDLAHQLTEAGHTDLANQVRDRKLAADLRGAGHDAQADALEGKPPGQEPPSKDATPVDHNRQLGESLLAQMREEVPGYFAHLEAE